MKLKPLPLIMLILCLCLISLITPGCQDTQQLKDDVAALQMQKDQLVADLEHAQEVAATQPDNEAAQLTIAKLTAKVKEYGTMIDKLNAAIQNAPTDGDAVEQGVGLAGAVGAAFAGPLAPLVWPIIGFGLGIYRRGRDREAGAALVAAGVEANRNTALEASNPGFIVFEKAGAAIAHEASGVTAAIESVSDAADKAIK